MTKFPEQPHELEIDYYYGLLLERVKLHEQALVWAVGTNRLPPTCPGHFMHLLLEAKHKVDILNLT